MPRSVSPNTSSRPPARREGAVTIGVLRAFVEAFEQGSFSKAAQELGVSQPNISNQVSVLEQALGIRLINRRGPALSLTDAGREVFVRARIALAKVAEIESVSRGFRTLDQGRLTVGFSSPQIPVPLLGRFRNTYQGIELLTRSGNSEQLRRDLLDCRIDLAMFSLLEPDRQLACHPLADLDLQLIVRLEDGRFGDPVPLARLVEESLVFREPGSVTRALTEATLSSYSHWRGPSLTVTGNAAVVEAVAAGLGVALLFRGETGNDRRVRAIDIAGATPRAGFYLATLPDNLLLPSVAAFIELATSSAL